MNAVREWWSSRHVVLKAAIVGPLVAGTITAAGWVILKFPDWLDRPRLRCRVAYQGFPTGEYTVVARTEEDSDGVSVSWDVLLPDEPAPPDSGPVALARVTLRGVGLPYTTVENRGKRAADELKLAVRPRVPVGKMRIAREPSGSELEIDSMSTQYLALRMRRLFERDPLRFAVFLDADSPYAPGVPSVELFSVGNGRRIDCPSTARIPRPTISQGSLAFEGWIKVQ
jgi:hypothetical protein